MDVETSQQIRKLTDLVEENNKMLRRMQSKARWATFFEVLKWLLFVGLAFGSYIVVEPYINEVVKLYNVFHSPQAQSQGVGDYFKQIQGAFKK